MLFRYFFNLSKQFLAEYFYEQSNNFQFYPKTPKMSDAEIVSLAICSESFCIDSENLFWKKLKV